MILTNIVKVAHGVNFEVDLGGLSNHIPKVISSQKIQIQEIESSLQRLKIDIWENESLKNSVEYLQRRVAELKQSPGQLEQFYTRIETEIKN